MRGAILSLLALGAVYTTTATPALARDYAYCAQGRGVGIPGDCSYSTYEQCQASASGRNLSCNINPRVAFARERGQRGYDRDYRAPRGYRGDDGYRGGYNDRW